MVDKTTQLANIIAVKDEFLATVDQEIADKSVYRQAGLIVDDAEMGVVANGPLDTTYNKRFFKALDQDESAIPTDNPNDRGEAGNISMGVKKMRAHMRAKAFSAMDLASEVLDEDVMGAIARRFGEYWMYDERATVQAMFKSIMTQSGFTHTINGVLDIDGIVDACATKGDFYENIEGLIVNKAVHTLLQKAEGNLYVPKSKTDIGFDTYAGLKLIVDSAIAPTAGVYTTVAFGRGAILSGVGRADTPVEYLRDAQAGNWGGRETLVNRRKFAFMPKGFSYEGTPALAASASNAELATAGAFVASDDTRLIPLVFIKSKLSNPTT
jgi:hypothetical protein